MVCSKCAHSAEFDKDSLIDDGYDASSYELLECTLFWKRVFTDGNCDYFELESGE